MHFSTLSKSRIHANFEKKFFMKYLIILSVLLISSCTKSVKEPDQNAALRCVTFSANKMYSVNTSVEPAASEINITNDTIEANVSYSLPAFSRTVSGYDVTKIEDSLVNSSFGDFGKKYRKCYDKSDYSIKVFKLNSVNTATSICK